MDEFVLILAGGKGERFWPASKTNRPKQVVKLVSEHTMIRETLKRTLSIVPFERTLIITGNELKNTIREYEPDISDDRFIIEPVAKNTAPAIILAAAKICAEYGDGVMYVLSSDHFISPVNMFVDTLAFAGEIVRSNDKLVLMGIQPTRAETAYGYIHTGEKFMENNGIRSFYVKSFQEKPSRIKAQEYYLSGEYLWNSGNFIFRAGKILEQARNFLPEFAALIDDYIAHYHTPQAEEKLAIAFEAAPSISIDYAILEKSEEVTVLWGSFLWDDLGSWSALERVLNSDRNNNVTAGKGKTGLFETFETTVYNDSDGVIVTFGVSDLVVVRIDNVTFVMNKTRISEMRELITKLKESPELAQYL